MLTVDEIMTTNVVTLQPEEAIFKGMSLMAEMHIRHIPVVDKRHQLLGILSHRDILRADLSCLANDDQNSWSNVEVTSLKSIMSDKVCSASPKDSLRSVGLILQRAKFGCVPIVDDGVLVGIVTDTDFVSVAISLIEEIENFEDANESLDESDEEFETDDAMAIV